MNRPKRPQAVWSAVAVLLLPSLAPAQTAVGSGSRMVGLYGPPAARTRIVAGKGVDDYAVALTRRGACNGDLAGPARAYASNVVTLSVRDPGAGATCTVDITYEPDFTGISVRESAACLSYHGAGCTFEGRFKRALIPVRGMS